MAKRSQLHIDQLNASRARRLGECVVCGGEGECVLLGEDEVAGLVGAEVVSPRAGVDGDGVRPRPCTSKIVFWLPSWLPLRAFQVVRNGFRRFAQVLLGPVFRDFGTATDRRELDLAWLAVWCTPTNAGER